MSRARLLLINPPVERVVEREYDEPLFPAEAFAWLVPPLRARGHVVDVLDAKWQRLSVAEALARAAALRPTFVGLSAYTHEIPAAARFARALKARLPSAPPRVVVGGPHATALPAEVLEEVDAFDLAFAGEGEARLPDLVDALVAGRSPGLVPGVAWREDGVVRQSAAPTERPDLARFRPDFRVYPPARHYFYSSSRGCPFTCPFCANPNGRVVRRAPDAQVLEVLADLWAYARPSFVRFGDENFISGPGRRVALLEGLRTQGLAARTRFEMQTHLTSLDDDLLPRLAAAGFRRVCFGLESGDPAVLRRIGKRVDLARARAVVRGLKAQGVEVELNAIIGHPGETLASAWRTVRALIALNPTRPAVGLMTPYPGTQVAAWAAAGQQGYRLRSTDWERYGKQVGGALELEGLPRWQMEALQLVSVGGTFIMNGRLGDLLGFGWRYRREAAAFARNFGRNLRT